MEGWDAYTPETEWVLQRLLEFASRHHNIRAIFEQIHEETGLIPYIEVGLGQAIHPRAGSLGDLRLVREAAGPDPSKAPSTMLNCQDIAFLTEIGIDIEDMVDTFGFSGGSDFD